jgi:hypothetical protein
LIDTLTSAPGRIALGVTPLVAAAEANSTLHGIGVQLTNMGGALIASVVIHLGLSLINYCKTKLFKSNGNQTNIKTQNSDTSSEATKKNNTGTTESKLVTNPLLLLLSTN